MTTTRPPYWTPTNTTDTKSKFSRGGYNPAPPEFPPNKTTDTSQNQHFKKGDRVIIIAKPEVEGTVTEQQSSADFVSVRWDNGFTNSHVYASVIMPALPSAPSLITIDRADLPTVTVDGEWVTFDYAGRYATSVKWVTNARDARRKAYQQLAIAEFLEAREAQAAEDAAAEKLAERVMQERRDEVALIIAEKAGLPYPIIAEYNDMPPSARAAIDLLIEREDARSVDS